MQAKAIFSSYNVKSVASETAAVVVVSIFMYMHIEIRKQKPQYYIKNEFWMKKFTIILRDNRFYEIL
jgi:hypothetical protein